MAACSPSSTSSPSPFPFPGSVVVLDINGVLANVRKRYSTPVPSGVFSKKEIYQMPNGQMVYLRPGALDFIRAIRSVDVFLIIWTSRLYKNALPVVQWLNSCFQHNFETTLGICDAMMTGEDCLQIERSEREGGPLLIKSIKSVRHKFQISISSLMHVFFVDDEPNNLSLDEYSSYLPFARFDAMEFINLCKKEGQKVQYDREIEYLTRQAQTLLSMIKKYQC